MISRHDEQTVMQFTRSLADNNCSACDKTAVGKSRMVSIVADIIKERCVERRVLLLICPLALVLASA